MTANQRRAKHYADRASGHIDEAIAYSAAHDDVEAFRETTRWAVMRELAFANAHASLALYYQAAPEEQGWVFGSELRADLRNETQQDAT
jgi:hypothetical protein